MNHNNVSMIAGINVLAGIIGIIAVFFPDAFNLQSDDHRKEREDQFITSVQPQQVIKIPENTISSHDAQYFIGQYKTVCGHVVQVSPFAKGVFLNFDQKFPHQTFHIVIWKDNYGKLPVYPQQYMQRSICIEGKIEVYKEKPNIILYHSSQIKGT